MADSTVQERLDFLRAKGPLTPDEERDLIRLQRMHADERVEMSLQDKARLAYLIAKSPRTPDETAELVKLEAGPFTVEQWKYLTDYIEKAILHRTSHRGRVPHYP